MISGGIIIYINKKFKNVLIRIEISDDDLLIRNVNRDQLYNQIYKGLTANMFINSINNPLDKVGMSNNLKYVVINENGQIDEFEGQTLRFLPVFIEAAYPDSLNVVVRSLNKTGEKLPTNIINATKSIESNRINSLKKINWFKPNIHLYTKIEKEKEDPKLVDNYFGLRNIIYNKIYRFSGSYEPAFNDVDLFENGNFKFNTRLENFSKVRQWIISKVNEDENILKLRNNTNYNSIYPMLDEFGYVTKDFYLFKSTWDKEFLCKVEKNDDSITDQNTIQIKRENL